MNHINRSKRTLLSAAVGLGAATLGSKVFATNTKGISAVPEKNATIFPGSIVDVPHIRVGHEEDLSALTGCSVVIMDKPAVCGVDVRGSAPGTRETDLLNPINLVDKVNALVLTGGSAYGLDAASGVMRYLEENNMGFDVGVGVVPIVPAAVIFDLALGSASVRPDAAMGYRAALKAGNQPFPQGNIGAGTGATVGKIMGQQFRMKGGLGTAAITLASGLVVAALVAANPGGEVRDPHTQELLAGALDHDQNLHSMLDLMLADSHAPIPFGTNTTIGIIACNANMNKIQMTKVAQMAHDGLARAIYPIHTMSDGDTIFAASTGGVEVSLNVLGALAAEVMARAVANGIKSAQGVLTVRAWQDLNIERLGK